MKNSPNLDKISEGNVSDLYKSALNVVKENELAPGQEALIQVRNSLNTSNTCKLEDSDILNIVLSDSKNLYLFQGLLSKDLDEKELFVNYEDFADSCNKVMQCTTKKNSNPPHTECINMIENAFASAQKDLKYQHELRMGNYGKDFFQNANSEDSPFDLLVDIEMIGNILFEGFKPSSEAEVLFYTMPERTDQDITQINDTFLPTSGSAYSGDPSVYGDIDRFSLG
jgi:hypothetical protein